MLLTIPQVARILQRSEHAVRHMIQRKQLPHRRAGRRIIVLEHELTAWLEALRGVSLEEALNAVRRGGTR